MVYNDDDQIYYHNHYDDYEEGPEIDEASTYVSFLAGALLFQKSKSITYRQLALMETQFQKFCYPSLSDENMSKLMDELFSLDDENSLILKKDYDEVCSNGKTVSDNLFGLTSDNVKKFFNLPQEEKKRKVK